MASLTACLLSHTQQILAVAAARGLKHCLAMWHHKACVMKRRLQIIQWRLEHSATVSVSVMNRQDDGSKY